VDEFGSALGKFATPAVERFASVVERFFGWATDALERQQRGTGVGAALGEVGTRAASAVEAASQGDWKRFFWDEGVVNRLNPLWRLLGPVRREPTALETGAARDLNERAAILGRAPAPAATALERMFVAPTPRDDTLAGALRERAADAARLKEFEERLPKAEAALAEAEATFKGPLREDFIAPLRREVEELRRAIEELSRSVRGTGAPPAPDKQSSLFDRLYGSGRPIQLASLGGGGWGGGYVPQASGGGSRRGRYDLGPQDVGGAPAAGGAGDWGISSPGFRALGPAAPMDPTAAAAVGAGGAPAGSVARVHRAGRGWTEVALADGSIVRREGARNWRNNNPGNLEYGDFARAHGAVGTDGRFAVFPDYAAGRRAKEALLFESEAYAGRTIQSAISRYAPPHENDTGAYVARVAAARACRHPRPCRTCRPSSGFACWTPWRRSRGSRPGGRAWCAARQERVRTRWQRSAAAGSCPRRA